MDTFGTTVSVIAIVVICGVLILKFGRALRKGRKRPTVNLELRVIDTGDSIEILVGDRIVAKEIASRGTLDQLKEQLTTEELLKYVSRSDETLKNAIDQDILGIEVKKS